jgi:DNA-directed RNA polymerase specialized sigma24 family protein
MVAREYTRVPLAPSLRTCCTFTSEILSRFVDACIKVSVERANIREGVSSGAYATASDFEQIFTLEMSTLYLLSFLLTGDREKAEECFVSSIAESAKANRVFKAWARSWARRTIIQSAIRLIAPLQHSDGAMRNPDTVQTMDELPLESQAEVSAILELRPLERFVFVMCALERYSDHECSILLGCARKDVTNARARALQHLVRLMRFPRNELGSGPEDSAIRESATQVIELTIARFFPVPTWSRANALSSA